MRVTFATLAIINSVKQLGFYLRYIQNVREKPTQFFKSCAQLSVVLKMKCQFPISKFPTPMMKSVLLSPLSQTKIDWTSFFIKRIILLLFFIRILRLIHVFFSMFSPLIQLHFKNVLQKYAVLVVELSFCQLNICLISLTVSCCTFYFRKLKKNIFLPFY